MSERSFVDGATGYVLDQIITFGKSIAKKSAELLAINIIEAAGSAIEKTIIYSENSYAAMMQVAARAYYNAMADEAFLQASRLPEGAAKRGHLLLGYQFQQAALATEQSFVNQFANGAKDFSSALTKVFGSAATNIAKVAGGVVGVIASYADTQRKLDNALENGEPPETAATIIASSFISTSTTTFLGLFDVYKAAVNTGTFNFGGNLYQLGGRGFGWALGRAGLVGMALKTDFDVFFALGTWINDVPVVNQFIGDQVEKAVALQSQGSNTTFPGEVATLAILVSYIDQNISVEDINSILRSSAAGYRSFEELNAFHNAIRKLLTPNLPEISVTSQDAFYSEVVKTLVAIKAAYSPQSLSIVSLAGKSAPELAAAGQNLNAFATRYALKALNPFVVIGVDYSSFNTAQELDIYNQATGLGEMSDRYIDERSRMLRYWMMHNLTDGQRNVDPSIPTTSRYYEDVAKGVKLIVDRTSNTTPTNMIRPMYVFGGDGNDTVFGNDENDVLFGGAGMDRIDGAKGDDYIEGNAGSDILTGGEGHDTLLGGTGSDILEGGKGNDILSGGLGNDTYLFTAGDGWDWLEDTDGIGHIEYDGVTLTGGKQVADSVWQKRDANGAVQFTYILTDWTENGETFKRLSIQGSNGGIFVKNWQPGQLGITLAGAPAAPPAPPSTRTIEGDRVPYRVPGWNVSFTDELGNRVLDPTNTTPVVGPDTLYDSPGADLIGPAAATIL